MKITLSQAIDGFALDCASRHLSPATIADYRNTLAKLALWLPDDPPLAAIDAVVIKRFLAAVRGPGGRKLANKTILNYHIGLSALWTWAIAEGYIDRHIIRDVPKPRPARIAIKPFSQDDWTRLRAALDRSRTYRRPGRRPCANKRPTALRDKAILGLLLDTGLRATELCELRCQDVDIRNQRIRVWGKGAKERLLPMSAPTTKAVWRYLQTRKDAPVSAPLFIHLNGDAMNRTSLRQLLIRIGDRAGVPDCHPHRFRHTFAIEALRNGMSPYALQMALGHSTMDMVRAYLNLVQSDLDAAHRRSSPVDHWGL